MEWSIIHRLGTVGASTTWFAETFLTEHVGWHWNMNVIRGVGGFGTLTGIRTMLAWNCSKEIGGFDKLPCNSTTCIGCILGSGVFEDGIHMLIRVAYPRVGEGMLNRYQSLKRRFGSACRHGLCKVLKVETRLLNRGSNEDNPLLARVLFLGGRFWVYALSAG